MPHIGERRRRVEDERLITGRGLFAADVQLPGIAHLAVRRSEVAHAIVERIDVTAAKAMPGVLAVFTAIDLPRSARSVSDEALPPQLATLKRPVLATGEVNHVGEALAVVVAEDAYAARDAADAVQVETIGLPASGTLEAALAPGAALVHRQVGTNVAWWGSDGFGDITGAFSKDAVIVGDRLVMNRVGGAAIEPRAATASPHGVGGVELWASTQAIFRLRTMLARALGLAEEQVLVRAGDVGGGFGPKGRLYPEDLLVAWAALRLQRPVKWVATRSEDSASSVHAHGSIFELELAANSSGTLRGLRGVLWHDIGAYPLIGALVPGSILRTMLSAYRLPAADIEVRDIFTNAVPTGTVRGGGGPEGNFAMERMMDRLAERIGVQPGEIRRRNLITPDAYPYTRRLRGYQLTVETGDLPRLLREAERQIVAPTISRGRLHGVGLAMGIENVSGVFRDEPARIRIGTDGRVEVFIGSSPGGQGHETMATQIVADRLGWPIDLISVTASDTTKVARSGPTASSRTAVNVGNALAVAARAARTDLLDRASRALRVQAPDLDLSEGWVHELVGAGRRWPATDFLQAGEIDVTEVWHTTYGGTNPTSCHLTEVAVDPETGQVEVQRYVVVYDSGVIINPLVVDGQITGGAVHGIGYALNEAALYARDGEFLTPTFSEYGIAGAADIAFQPVLVPCPTVTESNPEGFKGAGEVGTIAAPAAVAAAVESAIRSVAPGARVDELPIGPETVLRLLTGGNLGGRPHVIGAGT